MRVIDRVLKKRVIHIDTDKTDNPNTHCGVRVYLNFIFVRWSC